VIQAPALLRGDVMTLRVIVALLVMLFFFVDRKGWSAETVQILDPGSSSSCGRWLENRTSHNYYTMEAWALGYLSGVAAYSEDLDPSRVPMLTPYPSG
jgi:hypothetical protein